MGYRVYGTYFPNVKDGDKEGLRKALKNTLKSIKTLLKENPETGVALYSDNDTEDLMAHALDVWISEDHITIEYDADYKYKNELKKEGFQKSKIQERVAAKEQKCSKCGTVIPEGDIYLFGKGYRQPAKKVCMKCGLHWWELSKSKYTQMTQGIIHDFQDFEYLDEVIDKLGELQSSIESSKDFLNSKLKRQINNLESCIKNLQKVDTTQPEWRNEAIKIMEEQLC